MHTAQRRLATWIAVWLFLWAACAPVLSNALAAASGVSWAEICRSTGSSLAQPASQGSSPDSEALHPLEHCPYCSAHSPSLGMPPAKQVGALSLDLKDVVPLAFLAAPRPLFAWVSAQPRAPPRV